MPSLPAVDPRALLPALAAFVLSTGCLVGGPAARSSQPRDDQLLSELRRQETWAGEAAAGRASGEELKAAQAGDLDAQADLRQRFRKLLRAAERATWVREATPAALPGLGEPEQAELRSSFDKAARLRKDAWDAADEIAQGLCSIEGPSPLSLADLRRGLAAVRAAAQVEKRIAAISPSAPAAKDPRAASRQGPRLAPAPPHAPKPFIEAAALLIERHPAEEDALRSFRPELAAEAAEIRAALADLRAKRPPPAGSAGEGATSSVGGAAPPGEGAGVEPGAAGPEAGPATSSVARAPSAGQEQRIELSGEARATLRRRGPPRAIVLRPDGSFVLRYDGPARCPSPPCPPSVDLRFGKAGERLSGAPQTRGAGRPPEPASPEPASPGPASPGPASPEPAPPAPAPPAR